MVVLVTGAAGFIGSYVCQELLNRGERVIAVDNFNNYYDVSLKKSRKKLLDKHQKANNLKFITTDISDRNGFPKKLKPYSDEIGFIIHLAGYAGVRHSIKNPFLYAD